MEAGRSVQFSVYTWDLRQKPVSASQWRLLGMWTKGFLFQGILLACCPINWNCSYTYNRKWSFFSFPKKVFVAFGPQLVLPLTSCSQGSREDLLVGTPVQYLVREKGLVWKVGSVFASATQNSTVLSGPQFPYWAPGRVLGKSSPSWCLKYRGLWPSPLPGDFLPSTSDHPHPISPKK